MWRSFFYAVGIGLLMLGGQSLVLDHIVTAKKLSVPPSVKKLLADQDAPTNSGLVIGNNQIVTTQSGYLPNYSNTRGGAGIPTGGAVNNATQNGFQAQAVARDGFTLQNNGSRFGPSRFSGPAYGNYGGGRVQGVAPTGQPAQAIPQSVNAGQRNIGGNILPANYSNAYGNRPAGSYNGSDANVAFNPAEQRIIQAKDWMPWCLFAAGTVVLLYTKSWRPRTFDN